MEQRPYTRRNPAPRKKRPSTITIPGSVGPHVKLVFAEMRRQNIKYDEIEQGSGVLRPTLKAWRHKNKPGLESIEAALGFLGWDFAPIPREHVIPSNVVEALQPAADRLGLSMPDAVRYAAEIAFRDHRLGRPR
ncbi:hypothetical protein [Methylobacterium isbiliense]|uniref:HTH cro/C1-type domain-containing protein n=1 Tax=Methylobacterium isbiliense TaxID=315478 RepID=A0ABQ4S4Q0_9HYPH|nr:hypothetical protein [Methylobacterium isbiliense]MDN3624862.1 hypothetical protein [Methylobacterium isbiliense]GJD98105.1 hypothetical protein GMJLKIPL_0011 [Methylobacterium isbiliense]